jgi:DNA polymerase-3 subunit epsilon
MAKRQIALDTETTGLNFKNGDRVIEIGCVELIDKVRTGRTYQIYINPERESAPEAFNVHGLSSEFLKDKPKFNEIVDGFLNFIKDSELLIHNAKFDIGMLNAELDRVNKGKLWDYVSNVVDTLELDKRLFADERKHSLDAICKRFEINTSERTFHGALIDTELLADVYIEMSRRYSEEDLEADLEQKNWVRPEIKRYNISLPKAKITEEEEINHNNFLIRLKEKEKVEPVFNKVSTSLKM